MLAARELGGPIIAMTVVLIAVYVPIGFQSGLTGALFTEFAFTLAGAVTISAIIALTLTPMMCSRFLKPIDREDPNWEAQAGRLHRPRASMRCTGSIPRLLRGSLSTRAGHAGLRRDHARQHLSSWRRAPRANWRRRRTRAWSILLRHLGARMRRCSRTRCGIDI